MVTSAWGTFGSVISSWQPTNGVRVHSDASYVYTFYRTPFPYVSQIIKHTKVGMQVSIINWDCPSTRFVTDTAPCHLGSNYMALSCYQKYLYFVDKRDGSIAGSFSISTINDQPAIAWNGTYYYTVSRTTLYHYTPTGSRAGYTSTQLPNDIYTQGLAYTTKANGRDGNYLVATRRSVVPPISAYILDLNQSGSIAASFWQPGKEYYSASVGNSSKPLQYGAILWTGSYEGATTWITETGIGAEGTSLLTPASLGRVKAIYR